MADPNLNLATTWPVKNIIYVFIMAPMVLAAFIEWFLFLAAFIYCLCKVYVKADHWSIRFLAVVMIIAFFLLRGIFLPIMMATLPFPPQVTRHFPPRLVSSLQWFAFWSFAAVLTLPWLFCVYQLVTISIGRKKRIKEVLDDRTAPKIVIIMPVYREDPEVLIKAVDSVVSSDYPTNCIHVFLSYDGGTVDESYLRVVSHLAIPVSLQTYPQSIDLTYNGARITVSRFEHGGKRHCQKQTFKLIDKIYTEYLEQNDNLFMLFIDSDCLLDRLCLQNFMYEMELKPGSKHNMLAMAGIITSTTEKNSLITVLQDMEYIHGQLFERSVESGCGAVTCLPGALTILRFSAFRRMAKYYFADKAEQCEDLFDYGKCYLGEDRWLTHLFMIGAKERYQIQMCTSAFCKTEAVQTFKSLLKQRRRWFLGYITNEVCMLTDPRLWRRYPLLCLVRFMQNTIRTTALLFFILVIAIITTSSKAQDLPVGFIAISLGLNYALMVYFGAKLKRFKAWLYPLMFILNPFFNWLYMVYGILTAGQRTWGGPRTDAATADENTTPEQAVEQAKEQGDEFNVKVETFRTRSQKKKVPIHPPEKISGRFSVEVSTLDGLPTGQEDLEAGPMGGLSPLPEVPRIGQHPHFSTDSVLTTESGWNSIAMPRDVESLTREEERAKLDMSSEMLEMAAFRIITAASDEDETLDGSLSPSPSEQLSEVKSPSPAEQKPLQETETAEQTPIEPETTSQSQPSLMEHGIPEGVATTRSLSDLQESPGQRPNKILRKSMLRGSEHTV